MMYIHFFFCDKNLLTRGHDSIITCVYFGNKFNQEGTLRTFGLFDKRVNKNTKIWRQKLFKKLAKLAPCNFENKCSRYF